MMMSMQFYLEFVSECARSLYCKGNDASAMVLSLDVIMKLVSEFASPYSTM